MEYIWEAKRILNESVYPIEEEDGTMLPIPLLYRAKRILSVKNSLLSITYEEGKDYLLEDGKLLILNDGAIERVKYKDYYLDEYKAGQSFGRTGGGYIFFGEGDSMHKQHIAVSYDHDDEWEGQKPKSQLSLLERSHRKLENKDDFRILFYGDSITTGANSSKSINSPPYLEPWPELFTNFLMDKYSHKGIEYINTAVGGTSSHWGSLCAHDRVAKYSPDLCVIAFGMNDGSGRVEGKKFLSNIEDIMDQVKWVNPDCDFILVATMLANPLVAGFEGYQEDYLPLLTSLKSKGCAIGDITSVHKYILQKKRYYDMSGNNVNHPNDFLANIYSQVLSSLFA